MQAAQVQRLAEGLADVVADHVVADFRVVLHADRSDDRGPFARRARGHQFRVDRLGGAQVGQAHIEGAGGAVAGVDHVLGAAEVGDAVGGQRRLDQHILGVQGLELFFGIAPGHQGDGLVEHVHHRGQLLARAQRRADVHHDGDVDAHLPRHVQRDVIGHAAVHQQSAVEFHWREHGRDRHAGADHLGQVAFAEHHFFAGGDIGCDGAKGDRQLVEISRVAAVGKHAFQQQREVLALDDAQRQAEAAIVAETEFLLDQEVPVILLAAKRHVLPGWRIGECLLPIDTQCELFQLINLVARRVQPADHRAHAGAGNCIDMNPLFLQGLEHADVGQPACGAAGQHQRPIFGRGVSTASARRGSRHSNRQDNRRRIMNLGAGR